MDIREYHQKARLANFPPNERWAKVEGIIFFQPQEGQPSLVSIGGRDHKGKVVTFWTDLPNAMYLMNLLSQLQHDRHCSVPSRPPARCESYDGGE